MRYIFPLFVCLVAIPLYAEDFVSVKQCSELKHQSFYQTEIYQTRWLEASADLPAHCIVQGEIEKRNGVKGKPYGIQFELRLPAKWNEKFLFQGAGGIGGVIYPAIGKLYPHGASGKNALSRGYAVVSTDSGHPTRDLSFSEDQQARLNYAYAAIGKVTTVAKQILLSVYQKPIKHNYFMGCSNGGREAMIAAMRFPLEFDGVIAGSAGFRVSRSVLAELWDNQALIAAAPKNEKGKPILANALTQADLDAVSSAVLKQCDALDGIEDGLINAWEKCNFRPEMVENIIGRDKVKLLNTLFSGAKNQAGEALYSEWVFDSGINSQGWRDWKLGSSQTDEPNSISFKMGLSSLTHYYLTPRQPNRDPLSINLDLASEQVKQTGGIHDADDLELSTFSERGGKMLIYHGVSDPIFSAVDLKNWYNKLQQADQNTPNFARLFFVPAMNHCGRGATVNDFDMLTVLENWVERGGVPDFIPAKAGELYPNAMKNIPLCPHPKIATYISGNPNLLESFECR